MLQKVSEYTHIIRKMFLYLFFHVLDLLIKIGLVSDNVKMELCEQKNKNLQEKALPNKIDAPLVALGR